MLGRIPLVSISDNRLGGMENSSLRYRSAIRALEFSTSRMVRPSFSRSVRRLFPAGSTEVLQKKCPNHTKGKADCVHQLLCRRTISGICYEFRTSAEPMRNARSSISLANATNDLLRRLLPTSCFCSSFVTDCLGYLGCFTLGSPGVPVL